MLIDLLLDGDYQYLLDAEHRGLLAKAARFVMAEDFVVASDQLSRDLGTVEKALPFARLPYPVCWLEFAHADREKFIEEDYDRLRQVQPVRIGWLLQQTDSNGSWEASMFWSFDAANEKTFGIEALRASSPNRIHISGAAALLCCDASKFSRGLMAVFELKRGHIADQADEWCTELFGHKPPIAPGYYDDWQGEPKYLAAALALMNSKNAAETVKVDIPAKLNKRRQRDGKLPFLDYHLLRIPGRYKQKNVAGEATGQQLRAHFVRGHFKVRRTGVFFWSTFQRGNPTLGFVHKDYILRPP